MNPKENLLWFPIIQIKETHVGTSVTIFQISLKIPLSERGLDVGILLKRCNNTCASIKHRAGDVVQHCK